MVKFLFHSDVWRESSRGGWVSLRRCSSDFEVQGHERQRGEASEQREDRLKLALPANGSKPQHFQLQYRSVQYSDRTQAAFSLVG